MVAQIAADRYARKLKQWQPAEHIQGTIIFIGSVSSQGNKGQIAYSATKKGLEGAAGDAHEGGHVPRRPLWRDSSRLYGHADGPGHERSNISRSTFCRRPSCGV